MTISPWFAVLPLLGIGLLCTVFRRQYRDFTIRMIESSKSPLAKLTPLDYIKSRNWEIMVRGGGILAFTLSTYFILRIFHIIPA